MANKLLKKVIAGIIMFFLLTEDIYAQSAYFISDILLKDYLEKIQVLSGMTSQIKVLELQYNEDVVTIDFARSITSYQGGNYTERMIGTLMMEMVFETTDAKAITLLIEGEEALFPEGNDYSYCTREDYNTYYKTSEDYDEDYSFCNDKSGKSQRD